MQSTLPNYFRITYYKPINSGSTVEVISGPCGSIYFDVYNYCGASYECTIYEADFRLLSFDSGMRNFKSNIPHFIG